MNKAELVQAVAAQTGITLKEAGAVVDAFMDTVKRSLKKGVRVSLVGFGSWEVRKRAARNGVNPRTGKKIKIPARKVVKFNPGKELRDSIK